MLLDKILVYPHTVFWLKKIAVEILDCLLDRGFVLK